MRTWYLREVELKVELPCWCSWWIFTLLIHESQAQLDYLQQVHITPQQLILVICIAPELSNGPGDNTREFCILQKHNKQAKRMFVSVTHTQHLNNSKGTLLTNHSNIVEFPDDLSDPLQLLIQVVRPNLAYSLAMIHSSCRHNAT